MAESPRTPARPSVAARVLRALLVSAPLTLSSGCVVVRFNEMEAFQTPAMAGDAHPLEAELRGHVLSPREAAVGGFSTVGAGGCGCH